MIIVLAILCVPLLSLIALRKRKNEPKRNFLFWSGAVVSALTIVGVMMLLSGNGRLNEQIQNYTREKMDLQSTSRNYQDSMNAVGNEYNNLFQNARNYTKCVEENNRNASYCSNEFQALQNALQKKS